MKVLVTGATGFVGSALIRFLDSDPDCSVVGMVRSYKDITINSSVELRLGEIGSSEQISINLRDIDTIIHTAGRTHIMNDSSESPIDEYRRVNTKGTIELAKLAANSGVKRFVFLSSIKVNGESTDLGAPFSINSKENPQDPYGLSKHEAEIGLQEISNNTDLEVVIIRPPLIYGPGVKGNIHSLIKVLKLRIPLPFASVKHNRRSMVGLDNLLTMIALCVRHPNAADQTFLISDNDDLSTYRFLKLLGVAIDKPAILFTFPIKILYLVAKLFRVESRAQRMMGTLQLDISHTLSHLDWEPPFSAEQGLKKLKQKVK